MIKRESIIIYVTFVIVFQLFSSCKNKDIAFDGVVYSIDDNRYGYEIHYQKKTVIKQEFIPAVDGTVFFKDSIDALKTMDLVLERLNDGKKPSLSKKDIEKLKIKF